MTEEQAIQTVWEGLSGETSIPVKLRQRRGLDHAQLAAVREAMQLLARRWEGKTMVPKRLAAAFVDLQGSMEWGRDQYSAEQQDEIEDAAVELVDLAYQVLGEE